MDEAQNKNGSEIPDRGTGDVGAGGPEGTLTDDNTTPDGTFWHAVLSPIYGPLPLDGWGWVGDTYVDTDDRAFWRKCDRCGHDHRHGVNLRHKDLRLAYMTIEVGETCAKKYFFKDPEALNAERTDNAKAAQRIYDAALARGAEIANRERAVRLREDAAARVENDLRAALVQFEEKRKEIEAARASVKSFDEYDAYLDASAVSLWEAADDIRRTFGATSLLGGTKEERREKRLARRALMLKAKKVKDDAIAALALSPGWHRTKTGKWRHIVTDKTARTTGACLVRPPDNTGGEWFGMIMWDTGKRPVFLGDVGPDADTARKTCQMMYRHLFPTLEHTSDDYISKMVARFTDNR